MRIKEELPVMMVSGSSFYLSTVGKLLSWARAESLWYLSTGAGCCADEVLNTLGCRYDMERFGCVPQADARQADLLIVNGVVSHKAAPYLRDLYDSMPSPKYVLAVGSCASCGGAFSPEVAYSVVPGVSHIIPVDAYVPGCPPRPEAIMEGLIKLQEKIRGRRDADISN
jgi:NADH-quinone oxidoreductase subunit B